MLTIIQLRVHVGRALCYLRGGVWLAGYSTSFGGGSSYAKTIVALRDGDLIVDGYGSAGGKNQFRMPMLMRLDPTHSSWTTKAVVHSRIQ
jgi:hypothetical protein